MYKFIIKRILFLIPTIIGVTFIIYAVMNITPGDPGRAILGTGVSQAESTRITTRWGMICRSCKNSVSTSNGW